MKAKSHCKKNKPFNFSGWYNFPLFKAYPYRASSVNASVAAWKGLYWIYTVQPTPSISGGVAASSNVWNQSVPNSQAVMASGNAAADARCGYTLRFILGETTFGINSHKRAICYDVSKHDLQICRCLLSKYRLCSQPVILHRLQSGFSLITSNTNLTFLANTSFLVFPLLYFP